MLPEPFSPTVNLLLSVTLVCVTWALVVACRNGNTILRDFFMILLLGHLSLLGSDIAWIIWDAYAVARSPLRGIAYRSIVLINCVIFLLRLRRSVARIQREREQDS